MKMRIVFSAVIFLLMAVCVVAQVPVGDGVLELRTNYFYNYETLYLLDFDFDNGINNPDIFSYTMSYTPGEKDEPVSIRIEFEMTADVPSLGLEQRQIFYVLSKPFSFKGSITMTTRDVDMNLDNIYYDNGELVEGLSVDESDFIPEAEFAAIQQVVMGSGKLPAGTYTFRFKVDPEMGSPIEQTNIIAVTNPATLDLVSPGGSLDEEIEMYTTYPVFQWESQDFMWNSGVCGDCGYDIRVAEYDPAIHSSVEEALSDNANLPFPDDGGYFDLSDYDVSFKMLVASVGVTDIYTSATTFQYPLTGVKPLEEGKTYVWQIIETFPTTSGPERVDSDIFAFTIPAMGAGVTASAAGGAGTNAVLQMLEQLLGSDTYNQLFTGELTGYFPTGVILLNDTQQLTQEEFTVLLGQFVSGVISVQSINVE